jgi:hypothetical protein
LPNRTYCSLSRRQFKSPRGLPALQNKFYFSVNSKLSSVADFEKTNAALDGKIKAIIADLKLQ